ncbi:MAG: hypothetical protein ACRDHP_20980, partial [Ktedonobacterales bacterium]
MEVELPAPSVPAAHPPVLPGVPEANSFVVSTGCPVVVARRGAVCLDSRRKNVEMEVKAEVGDAAMTRASSVPLETASPPGDASGGAPARFDYL